MWIPVILSAFTHMLNPVGYPCVQVDEGIYMRRAMHVLAGLGPQDPASRFDHGQASTSSYDHPYFGQLFLAGVFAIIGYPSSITPSSSGNPLHLIEMLYMVPRILMGILAVVDTFLIYKISERRYNRNVALIASVIFAVMPLSWLLRRILLDTILMPFLLSSIFFALGKKRATDSDNNKNKNNNKNIVLILLSGIFLGMAIFTKIPAFTMIPLVGFLIYTKNKGSLKMLGLWLIPVISIPMIWPAYAIITNHFDEWLNGVLWQATGRQGIGIKSILSIFKMDPTLVALGITGVIYVAIIRKDLLLVFWLIPFLVFASLIGWVVYFHWMLVLPAFCIAGAIMIEDLSDKFSKRKKISKSLLKSSVTSAIGIFGLISTILLITNNFSLSLFEAAAYVVKNVQDNTIQSGGSKISKGINHNNDMTIVSGPIYSWIFKYIFNMAHILSHPRDSSQPITNRVLLMVDSTYRYIISNAIAKTEVEDKKQIGTLGMLYNNSKPRAFFVDNGVQYNNLMYPYTGIKDCPLSGIEIRTNY